MPSCKDENETIASGFRQGISQENLHCQFRPRVPVPIQLQTRLPHRSVQMLVPSSYELSAQPVSLPVCRAAHAAMLD
jgi:hypothetical protein